MMRKGEGRGERRVRVRFKDVCEGSSGVTWELVILVVWLSWIEICIEFQR